MSRLTCPACIAHSKRAYIQQIAAFCDRIQAPENTKECLRAWAGRSWDEVIAPHMELARRLRSALPQNEGARAWEFVQGYEAVLNHTLCSQFYTQMIIHKIAR